MMIFNNNSEAVFSTYVEVILTVIRCRDLSFSFLHVCGGDPDLLALVK